MQNYKTAVTSKIKEFKNKKFTDVCIRNRFKNISYELLLITSDCIDKIEIIRLLAFWRKKHEFWFPAKFKVTIEGTRKWLKEKVISEKDRMLFMIKVKNSYIGHVGLFRFDFSKKCCEIDNIVRGKNLYKGIMTEAIKSMMEWGREELSIKNYSLQTSSDNIKAIRLYHRLGFKEFKRTPLIRVKNINRLEWINAPDRYKGVIKRYNVYMNLTDGSRLMDSE